MHIDLLATKSVLGTTEWTLKNLPQGLKELDKAYDDVITRIQTQDEEDVRLAEQIITWLYYAIRPLTLQELRHALATRLAFETDPDATELDENFLPDDEVIVSVCAGIVALHLESNTVALVHYTTKELRSTLSGDSTVGTSIHFYVLKQTLQKLVSCTYHSRARGWNIW